MTTQAVNEGTLSDKRTEVRTGPRSAGAPTSPADRAVDDFAILDMLRDTGNLTQVAKYFAISRYTAKKRASWASKRESFF